MKINIIGTVNGVENEGMRNIATHFGREFEKMHKVVVYSQLNDPLGIAKRCYSSDITFVFARASGKIYWICRMFQIFSNRFCFVLVQPPQSEFVRRCEKKPLHCDYLFLPGSEKEELKLLTGCRILPFSVGIDTAKFAPISRQRAVTLKKKYGLEDKPVVLHVGHLSSGRGLEDLLMIDSKTYQLLVVVSGMFEDKFIEKALRSHGVQIIKGYLSKINEIYQMSDVYLFPTKSTEYVISIPLSVMEALASGTPTVAYRSFDTIEKAGLSRGGGVLFADSSDELTPLIKTAIGMKSEQSYLANPKTWEEAANDGLKLIMKGKRI